MIKVKNPHTGQVHEVREISVFIKPSGLQNQQQLLSKLENAQQWAEEGNTQYVIDTLESLQQQNYIMFKEN